MFDILIIGAGPSGLCAAKTILELDGARVNLRLVDGNKTIGGVWARENLYPGLRTNNLKGFIDFTDFPMHDGFGVPDKHQIPGEVVHEYLKQYAQKWDILRRIEFETFVSDITKLEDREGWNVKVVKNNVEHDMQTRKLIVATGINHAPHRPHMEGIDDFNAPIIHSAEMGTLSGPIMKDTDVKTVAVLGGSKSAYDAVYLAATSGKRVEWIVRKSGKGPRWVFPPWVHLGPFGKLNRETLPVRRIVSCFSPCFWPDGLGWIRSILHATSWGKTIAQKFWRNMHAKTIDDCQYKSHPLLNDLEPEQSPFWYGTSSGVYNYSPDLFDYVRSGQIRIHRADITHLKPHTIHLDSTTLTADALITATGFSAKPTLQFSPPHSHSSLGIPTTSLTTSQSSFWTTLNHKAELTIVSRFPRLLQGPFASPSSNVIQPYNPGLDPELQYTPYRLYRAIAPPGLAASGDRSLVFIGMISNIAATIRLELQCLWAYAYLNDKLTLPSEQNIYEDTALLARYCRYRAPFGHGRWYPDLVFDQMPYFDMLCTDLGLKSWRKGNWFKELFGAYGQADYRGVVGEWLKIRERVEGREIKRSGGGWGVGSGNGKVGVNGEGENGDGNQDAEWEDERLGLLTPRTWSRVGTKVHSRANSKEEIVKGD